MWRGGRTIRGFGRGFGIATALVALAASQPAAAQFSDAYNFLKAVRDKDGGKATQFLDKPGNTIVNLRDADSGDTALHIVTRRSDLPWMGFMIGKGANVNVKDGAGSTPLVIAAISRFSEGIDLLLKAKAQPDIQNRLGETALLKAVQNRDTTSAKLLIDAGASPDIADSSGVTARSAAAADPRAAAIARMLKDIPVRSAKPVQGPTR